MTIFRCFVNAFESYAWICPILFNSHASGRTSPQITGHDPLPKLSAPLDTPQPPHHREMQPSLFTSPVWPTSSRWKEFYCLYSGRILALQVVCQSVWSSRNLLRRAVFS